MNWRSLVLSAAICGLASGGLAHGAERHTDPTTPPLTDAVTPLPWKIGGAFELIDHTGAARSQVEPDGRMQLVFFGYANCPGICSAALPMMADAADILETRGIAVTPVMITIDPVLDTVGTMGPALAKISPDLVGLTGSPEALAEVHAAFQISFEKIMNDPQHGPIYAHGSHIYLLDATGRVLTLMPPVLPADHVADIVTKYAKI
ncbi:protein SCO1/2 [Roseovarius azorensis]|uniref:Protein SCO1/2 n=1 Tax=Roseovarius azorensis TaxID=1287727 RepID=A0A1H7J7E5_9RHOB|nr:SCO family protein [Roseovarius azorensis]SEK70598.1 protein SCO1/2 [Roseovarius azorensis]